MAIVHDHLNQMGGAERVVLELAAMWPAAPIFTSLYRPESTYPDFGRRVIRTSFLDRVAVDRRFRALAPLYPLAFRSLGTLDHALVISSSSGWSHGIRTAAGSRHIVYCHTPARWLYQQEQYFGARGRRVALAPLLGALRHWDRAAAGRADLYIANSHYIRARIKAIYGLEAPVIPPPVDIARFTPRPRGDRLLVLSRLMAHKRVDVLVEAATRAGLAMDVVGDGPALEQLRARAGPSVTFHGRVDERAVVELLEACDALCMAGPEDFGIAPVEAHAAGKPVVALAAGGALETVQEDVSGAFFHELDSEAVLQAIRRVRALSTPPEVIARTAERFSPASFRTRMRSIVTHLPAAEEQR